MDVITTALGPFGLGAIFYVGLILSALSNRLNAVAKKADYRGWFLLGNGLIATAVMSSVIRNAAKLAPELAVPALLEPWFALLTFQIPLALGSSVLLLLVWYYWGWMLKGTPSGGSAK